MFHLAAPASPRCRLFCAALLIALAACGSPASKATSGGVTDTGYNLPDLSSGDGSKSDGSKGDGSEGDLSGDNTSAPDDGTAGSDVIADCSDAPCGDDSGSSDTAQGGCEFTANPLPGQGGATCKTSNDCDSGACVDGPNGLICTQPCVACCPTGFKCSPYQTSGGDTVQMCLPKWNALCRPCETDAECAKLGKDSLCVDYKIGGSFCGGACQVDSDCPGDYKCKDAQGEKGAGKQCVKTVGECSCSPQAIADGAQTTCKIQNSAGTCSAVRKCVPAGLPACGAATPAPETCGNGIDDDCNGQTDENGAQGCTQLWTDGDGDGDGKAGSTPQCQCAPSGLYTATTATDCDDTIKAINGKATEICDNIDNNCNGLTDEGCDDDGDGWCDANMVVVGDPLVCKKGTKDCDDTNAAINPGEQELCGNNIDDNCDGLTDSGPNVSGCVPFYADGDGDGYGTGDPTCQCGAKGVYSATKTGDCADNDPNINPGEKELCGNQKDDDCNGLTDEAGAVGCTNYFVDLDGDGFGTATPTCLCAPDASHTALQGGDCNDSAIGINPAATETCNGVDDNCNGFTDEMGAVGCVTYYTDADGDGFGNPATGLCLCNKTALSTTAVGGDCNDDSAAAHPGATEICDGLDNNCNGVTDEQDATGCTAYYVDADNDGWGDSTKSACLCAANATYKVAKLGDCNDNDASINPAAKEICDGIDNNCVDGIDEAGAQGCSIFWRDHDGDKFGALADSQCLCAATGEYTATKSGDCNDNDKNVNPKATETCDGIDNDCDGVTDPANSDGCTAWYIDKDGDNWGATNSPSKCLCSGLAGYASQWGDCNDNDPAINPGATEICDGKDNDCDGVKDPPNSKGCMAYYVDLDSDGYGASGLSECLCAADNVFTTTLSGDCAPNDATINPGAKEICNGIDDNCNGLTDEGLTATYFVDGDGDGFGVTTTGIVLCAPDATHKVTTGGDCDDTKATVYPGAQEVCNGVDDNCNGQTDEGLSTTTYFTDADKDGYGVGVGNAQCGPLGAFTASLNGDCNDSNAAINPGAAEVCDSLDNNCNGQTDEGLPMQTYYQDLDGDGYGNAAVSVQACAKPAGYAVLSGDCNDLSANAYPGHPEICGDGMDNNCDGQTDEGCTVCQPVTLVDFENQDVSAWTLAAQGTGPTPGWALYTPGFSGTYSLEYTDVPNVHGYTPYTNPALFGGAKHYVASVNLQIPAFTKVLTMTVDWEPYVKGIFGTKALDGLAKMDITFQGLTSSFSSSTAAGKTTINFILPTIPAVATTMLLKFDLSQGSFLQTGTLDPSGFVGIDDIRITCP